MNSRIVMSLCMGSGVLLFVMATPAQAACENCGPGAHWVDACAAGLDSISPHGAVIGIDTDFDCFPDTSLRLFDCPSDPQIVDRSAPQDDSANYPGTRPADGHDDVIDTEIVRMCLTGGGVIMIAGAGQQQGPSGVLQASLGTIAEQVGDNAKADSFFDVYFEIDLGAGSYAYNHTPLRMSAVGPDGITCVPPDDTDYFHPTGCTPLFDDPDEGEGVPVANLVAAQHFVNYEPPVGACCTRPLGLCLITTERLCPEMKGGYRGDGTSCLDPGICTGIPTVSEWGMAVMVLLVMAAGTIVFRRFRLASKAA